MFNKININWQKFWQRRQVGNFILLPFSMLFYGLVIFRRLLYKYKLLSSSRPRLPVIIIGNINVGGAGKTSLVISLGQLLAQNGIRYAVISRGYGGQYNKYMVVEDNHLASMVGDEPLLIKLQCNCPVVVAKSRVKAAEIVYKYFPDTQIILSDDGLQHYALQRDIEICVINEKMRLGNRWMLPAGGLREPISRLDTVDFVIYNGLIDKPYHYVLVERAWHHINSGKKRYHDEFAMDKTHNLAFSGIAHPHLFFEKLKELGINAQTRFLPDHYKITEHDLPINKTLLMTAKDWVKAKDFAHDDAWYLRVEAILSNPLKKDLLLQIKNLINNND